jgi:3-methyladenine DNA glycosylase AlkD
MKTVTGKKEIRQICERLSKVYGSASRADFIQSVQTELLQKKIKFPLLEFAAREMMQFIPRENIIPVTDKIIALHEMGGNVIAGTVLQSFVETELSLAIKKAREYIIEGNEWYCCDIISERVMGYALLINPTEMVPVLEQMKKHESPWIHRSIGVAAHYAVKKGLSARDAEKVFNLLISLSSATDYHTTTGIGWGAKTIAKFHPEIIQKNEKLIQHKNVKSWFRRKIAIGLSRHAYNNQAD